MHTFSVKFIVLYFVSTAVSNNSDCQGPSIETPKLYEYILLSDHGICIGNPVTDSVNFKVNARSDAHIALMSSNSDHDPIYEIIIGGWANSRSIIRDSKEGLPLAMHHGPILKQNMYKTFNISWSHGNIRVKDGSKATIMEWTDTSSPLKIRNIGISTWWGSTGNWSFPCQDCQEKEKKYQKNTELQECQGPSIKTPNLYKYILLSDYGIVVENLVTDSISFKVKASRNVQVALMSSNTDQDPLYEIVLGGWINSKSVIRDSKEGVALATHEGQVLKQTEYRTFYISWRNGHIKVKNGSKANIMEWTDTSSPLKIRNIGISTRGGSTGNWTFPCQDGYINRTITEKFGLLIGSDFAKESDCLAQSIETPNLYKYIMLSDNGICIGNPVTESISFKVKAKSDAHIALMSSKTEQDPLYEIILGGWANSKSIIRYSKEGLPLAIHRGPVLKPTVYRTFYIKWNNGHIRVEDGSKATIMEWTDTSSSFEIRNIGISTGWGSIGNWSFPCRDCQETNKKIQKNTTLQECQGPSIETPNLYKYILLSDYGIVIENLVNDSINFKVKATRNVHVALMSSNTDQDPLYEIVLGGWINSKSVIRDSKEGVAMATHEGQVLKQTEYTTFYITWRNGHIRVENGSKANIMEWTDTSSPLKIRNIGISTKGGSTGNWTFPCQGIQEQENIISNKKTEILFILLTAILFVIVTFIFGCLFIRHFKRNRVRSPSSKDEVDRGNVNEIYDEIDIALEINVNNSVYLTPPGDDQIGIHEMRDVVSTSKQTMQNIVEQKMRDFSMRKRIRSPSPRDHTDTGSTNEVYKEIDIALEINFNNSVHLSSSGNDQIENHEMPDAVQISTPTSIQPIQGIAEQAMRDISMPVLPETTKQEVSETEQVPSEDNLSELNSRRSSLSSESEYNKCFNSISSYNYFGPKKSYEYTS